MDQSTPASQAIPRWCTAGAPLWYTIGGWLVKQVLTDPYLDEIVRVLKAYDPERLILFGSRARGEADEYSDYDLMVIKCTDRPFLDRLRDMVPYLRQITRPADILVYTPEEFACMGETGLGWVVRQEGVTLYERPSS